MHLVAQSIQEKTVKIYNYKFSFQIIANKFIPYLIITFYNRRLAEKIMHIITPTDRLLY